MEKKDEFYVGYSNSIGKRTKRLLRKYVLLVFLLVVVVGAAFSYFQNTAANSSFEFDTSTSVTGIYYEAPYPMLRVTLAPGEFKDIVLLGFGKYGANPYLEQIRHKGQELVNKKLTINGNLIYYNGKTLLQIDESTELKVEENTGSDIAEANSLGVQSLEGEIVDPKCYFGVMKPGYGKIHRSCAARCISGGIPPVLVSWDDQNTPEYFLLTDLKGNPINQDIIPYIGQPSRIKGNAEQIGGWNILRIDIADIENLNRDSQIY